MNKIFNPILFLLLIFFQVGDEEFVCSGDLDTTDDNMTASVTINGKKEKFSFVTHDDSLHIFTKVIRTLRSHHYIVAIGLPRCNAKVHKKKCSWE